MLAPQAELPQEVVMRDDLSLRDFISRLRDSGRIALGNRLVIRRRRLRCPMCQKKPSGGYSFDELMETAHSRS
jgi:hypothetical protein